MPTNLTDLSNLHEHPAYQLGDRIQGICAPLFNNFPISYFGYARKYYDDNTVLWMASDKDWVSHYIQGSNPFFFKSPKTFCWSPAVSQKTHMASWLSFIPSKILLDMDSYNHHNGVGVQKNFIDYIEILEFTSPNKNATPLEFCSDKDLLNQFLAYFKEKASNIIKVLEREPLCLPKSRFLKLEDPDKPYTDFCQAIKTKRLPFKFQAKEVNFTRREFEILSLLIKGKSMREVATILQISPRTVEAYLYKAKNKTNLFTVNRLLDHFAKSLF